MSAPLMPDQVAELLEQPEADVELDAPVGRRVGEQPVDVPVGGTVWRPSARG
jgi:hypothetical protein